MKQIMLFAIACMGIFIGALGQCQSNAGQTIPLGYELYSWQDSNGRWSFCLLASPSGVNISADQVFNKRFLLSGVKNLKRKISGLPEGATIYWLKRISATDQKAREDKKLKYPSSEILRDIIQYAQSRKITVEVLSEQQDRK